MKIWIGRALALLFLLVLAPVAGWLQRLLSNKFGTGDGEISRFAIDHMVIALPTLTGFLIAGLCLWWLRRQLSNQKLVVSICTLLITFGALNFMAEVLIESSPKPDGDDNDHRAPYPFIEFKGSFKSGKHNVLGYGGKVPDPQKQPGEYRIIFLGGSTVRFGDPAIPALVEQLFRAEGFDEVQVFNFGVSGSNTGMELARIVFELLEYEPDMIVSYSGGNDIHLPLIGDPRPGYPYNFAVREYNPLLEKNYPSAALTAYSSYLLRLFAHDYFQAKFSHMEELRKNAGWKSRPWREQIAREYVDNVETSARIANAFNSAFVAFLQPSLLTKKTPSEAEQAQLDEFTAHTEKSLGVNFADWKLHDEFIRNRISSLLSAVHLRGFRFVDLSAEFDGIETTLYKDLIHKEQHSNELISQRIFEALRLTRTTNKN